MGSNRRSDSDESYIIDLCDHALQQVAVRQHHFDFLRGDAGTRRAACLPVDAFYEPLKLVVEFHERQHSQPVAHFDKPSRLTVSGVPRSEQRKRYDQRRRETLPAMGMKLVEFRYNQFSHRLNGKLRRVYKDDQATVDQTLAAYLPRDDD